MEKRKDQRVLHEIQAKLEPGAFVGGTKDMSTRGIFLRSNRVLPVGTQIQLLLHLPSGWAKAEGMVRWT